MKWLILFLPLFAFAEGEPTAVTHEELCKYDSLCTRVRNADGSTIRPKVTVQKLIEEMADPIFEFSKIYGVDPRAVAGAILAENTMNVQIDDALQDWIVKNKIWGSKNLLSKGMSVGPGQINLEPAMQADRHIAKLGLRQPRSADDISQRLLTPAGAAEYAAAIIRQAQDAYKEKDIDISKRPDVLVSLYNLGGYEKRAEEAKAKGIFPRPNFFGFFVAENLKLVEETLGWNPTDGRTKKAKKIFQQPGLIAVLKDDLELSAAPPTCRTEGAGDVGELGARLSWERYPTFTAASARYAEIVQAGVDCQMRDWVQVRTNRGELGWVARTDLTSVARELPPVPEALRARFAKGDEELPMQAMAWSCSAPDKKCQQKALEGYGSDEFLGSNENGMQFLRVKSHERNDAVDWKHSDGCYNRGTSYAKFKESILQGRIAPIPLAEEEIKRMKGQLEQQLENVIKQFKLDSASDPRNPYREAFRNIKSQIEGCLEPTNYCSLYPGQEKQKGNLKEFLETDLSQVKSFAKMQEFVSLSYSSSLNVNTKTDPDALRIMEEKKQKEKDARLAREEKLAAEAIPAVHLACDDIAEKYPKLGAVFKKAMSDLMKITNGFRRYSLDSLKSITRSCEQVETVQLFQATGKFPWGTSEYECEFYQPDRENKYLLNFSLEIMSKMDLQEADLDSLLGTQFKYLAEQVKDAQTQMAQVSGSRGGRDQEEKYDEIAVCNFNQLKTIQAIENLAANDCVETILVGDFKLSKGMASVPKARIIKDASLPEDRIAFTYKNTCRGEVTRRPYDGWRPAQ